MAELLSYFHRGRLGLSHSRRDVSLQVSCDGFKLVNMKTHEIPLVTIINPSLPQKLRYGQENILTNFYIIHAGPKKYRDLGSFLFPLIQELEELDDGVPHLWDANRDTAFSMREGIHMFNSSTILMPARKCCIHMGVYLRERDKALENEEREPIYSLVQSDS